MWKMMEKEDLDLEISCDTVDGSEILHQLIDR